MSSAPRLGLLLVFSVVACGDDPAGLGDRDLGPVALGRDGGANAASCGVDDDCPFGQVCRGGQCLLSDVSPSDRGCWVDRDCEEGFVCASSTGRCVSAASFPVPPEVQTTTCAEGRTRRCGTKIGACAYGTERCVSGSWSGSCEGGTRPALEICDGLDNDCNGAEDELFVLGIACAAGVGVCRQEGSSVCSATRSSTTCSVSGLSAAGRVELCGNSLDDDCDDEIDEGFELGIACQAGVGACARSGVTSCSSDGTEQVCSASAGTAAPTELCGGAPDDDCDGEQNEGFEDLGALCNEGIGACRRYGTLVCSTDQLSLRCSATAGLPGSQELCGNTVDEDCDGQTNEGFALQGQPCTVGSPPCQSTGVWVCSPSGTQLECQLPPASVELCNGADDDLDSCTDEGFDVGASCTVGVGACARTGTKVCLGNGSGTVCNVTAGIAGTELCGNGVDDDCDGQTDEGFTNLAQPCTAGQGICLRAGAFVCSANRLSTTCDAVQGTPNAQGELCGNGADDDCDGQTDEGYVTGGACTVGQGICQRSGQTVCAANGLSTICSASSGAPNPLGELCGNGLDDDCDGSVDEGFNVGASCNSGFGICQRSGTYVCTVDRLGTQCNATPGTPLANELCGNGADDDCDGQTDEGFPNLGTACTNGVGACQRSGTYVCTANRLATVCNATAGTSVPEVCDNIDNDCNSVVDNGCDDDNDNYCDANMTTVGSPPVCPLTTNAATRDCNDADAAINPGAVEICNDARDQNCDGNLNDGCPACNVAIDRDFDGANECVDCDETNGAVRPGAAEVCDGLDNDCDGAFDETFDADGDGYTTCGTRPTGGLDPAYVDCDDTNANRYPFACELCALGPNTVACGATNDRGNGVDEDCDGYLDETCSPCSTADPDGDGYSQCAGDCAPANGNVSPGRAETCDGLDTDCNQTTTENCEVGDQCNWPGTPPPDSCAPGLLCVESLGPSGQATGNFTCTSFCNFSPLGLGLGDGCQANQTCSAVLTPTANLHGCAVSTDIGPTAVGGTCSADDQCRSSRCLRDQRAAGPPQRYCSDLCGNDSYCGGGTTCQVWGSDTGQCWRTLSVQDRGTGVACNDTPTRCLGGSRTCTQIAVGNRICSQVCCDNDDCPNGYFCSPNGSSSPGPVGGVDTVPVCWPEGAGTHNRQAGAACTSNGQCESEFCDRTLDVCVDLCCNDADCPTGLSCEQVLIRRSDNNQTFGRACVNVTPAGELQAL